MLSHTCNWKASKEVPVVNRCAVGRCHYHCQNPFPDGLGWHLFRGVRDAMVDKPIPARHWRWMEAEGVKSAAYRPIFFPTPVVRWHYHFPAARDWDRPFGGIWDLAGELFRHRSALGKEERRMVRQCLDFLRYCWLAHNEDRLDLKRWCHAEARLLAYKVMTSPALDRAGKAWLADQRRSFTGVAAHGLPTDWTGKIRSAIRSHPDASNRFIAALVGCGEATVRRHRQK